MPIPPHATDPARPRPDRARAQRRAPSRAQSSDARPEGSDAGPEASIEWPELPAPRRVVPIAMIDVALAARAEHRSSFEGERQRTVVISAIGPDTGIGIAGDDLGPRVAEPVAVTGREDRDLWRHRGDECRRRRCTAAMMRNDEEIRLKGGRVAADEIGFGARLDVHGEWGGGCGAAREHDGGPVACRA